MREEAKKGFHQSVPTLHHLLTWASAPRLLRRGAQWHMPQSVLPLQLVIWSVVVPRSQSNIRGVNLSWYTLHYTPMHYRLRPIKRGQFRLTNFAPHFERKCHFHFLIH